jgi:hypothetical protein
MQKCTIQLWLLRWRILYNIITNPGDVDEHFLVGMMTNRIWVVYFKKDDNVIVISLHYKILITPQTLSITNCIKFILLLLKYMLCFSRSYEKSNNMDGLVVLQSTNKNNRFSLTPPHCIAVPVPSQESKGTCICVYRFCLFL